MIERVALIMAGGGGTRLWPVSSAARPKPLITGLGAENATLLGSTVARLQGVVPFDRIFVVTTESLRQATLRALPELTEEQVIGEPAGRNTAACIALALIHLRYLLIDRGDASVEKPDDLSILVLPADHHIEDVDTFRKHLDAAFFYAETRQQIVTLGIAPVRPDTGFGYIERESTAFAREKGKSDILAYPATRFVEKPDRERAEQYLESGRYLWNAGIFALPMARVEQDFARLCPTIWPRFHPIRAAMLAESGVQKAIDEAYAEMPSHAIDTAIMEKLNDLCVIPLSVGWDDVGSWASLTSILSKDDHGNVNIQIDSGNTMLDDCRGCMVWNEQGELAVVGVEDLVVVVTNQKVLVCSKAKAQEVRRVAQQMNKKQE